MEALLDRLSRLRAALRDHPEVDLICDFVGAPVPEATLAATEARLGSPLDVGLREFYRCCNGVSICWRRRSDARPPATTSEAPVWYCEDGDGQIIVEPIETVFGPRMAAHDLREVAAEGYDGESVVVFGQDLDAEDFFSTTWALSWFFENNAVLISSATKDAQGNAALVVQGDQGIEASVHPGLSFSSWLDFILRTYGHINAQREISRGWSALTPPDSLDALLEEMDRW